MNATFAQDMTDEEKRLMGDDARYMHECFMSGKILIYGPVMATGGAFGVAVLEVGDEAEARELMESDPSVLAGLNKFELCPMRVAGARACDVAS
jgi:uncharacterized protein YciI